MAETELWLDRDVREPERLNRFFEPFPSEVMEMCRVSDLVNSARNNSPDCIASVRV